MTFAYLRYGLVTSWILCAGCLGFQPFDVPSENAVDDLFSPSGVNDENSPERWLISAKRCKDEPTGCPNFFWAEPQSIESENGSVVENVKLTQLDGELFAAWSMDGTIYASVKSPSRHWSSKRVGDARSFDLKRWPQGFILLIEGDQWRDVLVYDSSGGFRSLFESIPSPGTPSLHVFDELGHMMMFNDRLEWAHFDPSVGPVETGLGGWRTWSPLEEAQDGLNHEVRLVTVGNNAFVAVWRHYAGPHYVIRYAFFQSLSGWTTPRDIEIGAGVDLEMGHLVAAEVGNNTALLNWYADGEIYRADINPQGASPELRPQNTLRASPYRIPFGDGGMVQLAEWGFPTPLLHEYVPGLNWSTGLALNESETPWRIYLSSNANDDLLFVGKEGEDRQFYAQGFGWVDLAASPAQNISQAPMSWHLSDDRLRVIWVQSDGVHDNLFYSEAMLPERP